MKTIFRWRAGPTAALLVVLAATPIPAADLPAGLAARIGDETISMAELEASVATELARLEQQRHDLLESRLSEMVAERLIAREALRRGMDAGRLVEEEVSAKARPVTDAEIDRFIVQNRARLPRDDASLRTKVAEYLRRQELARRRSAWVADLRVLTPVEIRLPEPAAIRVAVDAGVGFARGPKDAPVSVVEFSDFQCPFCKAATATIAQIAPRYRDRVRWVFRDFPIASLHPEAPLAHEAARCAAEQDRFWAYHDVLFEEAPSLAPARLKEYAARVGLDPAAFATCLDSHRHRPAIERDIDAGRHLGVSGTPTFFVNGRPLVGNPSPATFESMIEQELRRAASTR